MAITISTSVPVHGQQDVYINKNLSVTFNKAVTVAKVIPNVFILTDVVRNQPFPVNPSVDPSNSSRVIVSLYNVLKENTLYRLTIVGSSDAVGTDYLTTTDSDSLTDSLIIEFTTGDQAFRIDTNIQKEAANLTLEGDLSLPQNVKALGEEFTISYIRPRNHLHNVPVNMTGDNTIRFTFNKALLTGTSTAEWTYIDLYPLMDYSGYLGISGSLQTEGSSYDYSLPTYTVAATGSDLLVTFSKNMPNNVGIRIDLTSNIRSSSGDYYGGALRYDITTQLYPDFVGVHSVARELNSTYGSVYDNYVGQLIFKNSIGLWERIGRGFSLSTFSSTIQKYVLSSTVLDIIEDEEYSKFVVAGTRRQLGDLNASVDSLVGRLAMKIASMKKLQNDMFETLIKGWGFKTVVKQEGRAETYLDRLWHNPDRYKFVSPLDKFIQPDLPASNVSSARQGKVGSSPYL